MTTDGGANLGFANIGGGDGMECLFNGHNPRHRVRLVSIRLSATGALTGELHFQACTMLNGGWVTPFFMMHPYQFTKSYMLPTKKS